jgi:hypothetical protein
VLSYLKAYGRLSVEALRRTLRAWPGVVALLVYPLLLQAAAAAVAPLRQLGGFVLAAVTALLLSSYLHMVAEAVAGTKTKTADLLKEVGKSFTALFSPVLSVMFSLWLIDMAVGLLTSGTAQAPTIRVLVGLATAVLLNPLPEVIYQQRDTRWFAPLITAGRFVTRHWPEWLLPNIALAAILLVVILTPSGLWAAPAGARLLGLELVFSIRGLITLLASVPGWLKPLMLIFVHWAMVFRGLLYEEIGSGSTRQRAIRDAWRR